MFFLLIILLLASITLTGLIRYFAISNKLLDIPNQRSSHTIPTPRGGGLAIVVTFFFCTLVFYFTNQAQIEIVAALSSALFVAIIGFYDDQNHVPARWRFLIHFFSASLAIYFIKGFPLVFFQLPMSHSEMTAFFNLGWFGYLLGIILLVWCLNLFNFMDGTDGIAASEAIFVCTSIAGFVFSKDSNLFYLNISLAATVTGFLGWNWPKAKIFMGDVGSGYLGLILGIMILLAAHQVPQLLFSGLILFGIFVVDATYTLIVRFYTGQKWYEAHCSHTYQRAAKKYGHQTVLIFCWLINLFWLLPWSILVYFKPDFSYIAVIMAYSLLVFLAVHFHAGQLETNNK